MSNTIKYFLASNTKRGFIPLFEDIRKAEEGNHFYTLKGGPGSGKSSLMRRISKALEEKGHRIDYFPCASDPNSIDGILDYDAKISIVDGTAPHTIDPICPGAYDSIINMGEDWDKEHLRKNKKDIIEISKNKSNSHKAATSCIKSASLLLEENMKMSREFINQSAIQAWTKRLTNELSQSHKKQNIQNSHKTDDSLSWLGLEQKRLLSAVSVKKTVFFEDTIKCLCTKLYVLDDDWGSASYLLLSQLHKYAIDNKIRVITCYCSISTPDKIEHLIFPSLKIGITTSNQFHGVNKDQTTSIYGLLNKINGNVQATMKRNLSSARQLINTASNHIALAKKLHDDLEEYYVTAMNFDKVDDIYDKILNEILDFQ